MPKKPKRKHRKTQPKRRYPLVQRKKRRKKPILPKKKPKKRRPNPKKLIRLKTKAQKKAQKAPKRVKRTPSGITKRGKPVAKKKVRRKLAKRLPADVRKILEKQPKFPPGVEEAILARIKPPVVPGKLEREVIQARRELERLEQVRERRLGQRKTPEYQNIKHRLQVYDAMRKGLVDANKEQIQLAHARWYEAKTTIRSRVPKYVWFDVMEDLGDDLGYDDQEIESYRDT